jgi:HAD superfamily hydrolase (TIGR01509 family)
MIKAICFDLDGVYFVNGKSNFIKNLREYDISKEEAERVFLKSDEMNKIYKEGRMSDEEFWHWAIKEWDINIGVQEIIDLLIEGYEVNKEVSNTVKRVRQNGYKTLICTNNFPARINGLHKKYHFLDNFDSYVFSYEIGSTKPSPAIFSELVKRSEVKAEEIAFADDNDENLNGAKEVGIQAFFYENFAQFKSKLEELGVKL